VSRLVIFDFDDTIVDTQSALLAARESALRQCFGKRIRADSLLKVLEIWRRLGRYFPPDSIESLAPAIAVELGWDQPSADQMSQGQIALREGEVKFLKAMRGASSVLGKISRHGTKLGLISNGRKDHQLRKLKSCGLSEYFDDELVLIAEPSSPWAKPAPDGIIEICRRANVAPIRAVVIGDRMSDIIAGRMAGCAVVYLHRLAPAARTRVVERTLSLEIPTYGISRLKDLLVVLNGHFGAMIFN
jgi:beta-phosphoglucomutase-like phosphatase (HAD superfamily)